MAVSIERKGMLFVISGPSGAGKGTLAKWLLANDPSFRFSCSATTRAPRVGELEGVHYHFVSDGEFDRMIENDLFLEHAVVHEHRYGTLRKEVDDLLAQGCNVLLDVDTQGAMNVMKKVKDYVSVFIIPTSYAMLRERLHTRNTDDPGEIERRVRNAHEEMKHIDSYQYVVINDDLELAKSRLRSIVDAEKQRIIRYRPTITED